MGGENGVSTVILDSGSLSVSVDVWFKVFIFEWGVVFFLLRYCKISTCRFLVFGNELSG